MTFAGRCGRYVGLGGATEAMAADCTSRVGCGLRSGNTDRLKYVSFIKRFCDAPACFWRPVHGLVAKLDA